MTPDVAISAETFRTGQFQVNVHQEAVCEFTGLVAYGCSHCAGLPWGEDPDFE